MLAKLPAARNVVTYSLGAGAARLPEARRLHAHVLKTRTLSYKVSTVRERTVFRPLLAATTELDARI